MKIAIMSTDGGGGGAARAMRRLVSGLIARGHHVDIFQLSREYLTSRSIVLKPDAFMPLGSECADFVDGEYLTKRRTALSNTLFTSQSRGLEVAQLDWLSSYDIINVHWVNFFLNPETIGKLIGNGRPLVFTLHDMANFTGGCHYSAGCDYYTKHCDPCPQLNNDFLKLTQLQLAIKRQLYCRNNVAAVAPSHWLTQCAAQSKVFNDDSVHHISNSVEIDLFRPIDRASARAALGLVPETFAILFGSFSNVEQRKGFKHLIAAMEKLRMTREGAEFIEAGALTLLIFGTATPEIGALGIPVIDLGYIADDERLVRVYNAANIVVLPSIEDNQPNIMLEAMSCGTPVVAFALGGMLDVIRDRVNGRLVPAFNTQALAQAILDQMLSPEETLVMGLTARSDIVTHATLDVQAGNYERLFETMVRRTAPITAASATDPDQSIQFRGGVRAVVLPMSVSKRIASPAVQKELSRVSAIARKEQETSCSNFSICLSRRFTFLYRLYSLVGDWVGSSFGLRR